VKPLPVFRFFAAEKTGCEAFTTSFYDSSYVAGGKVTNRLWNFGDGNLTYREQPTHTFIKAGEYKVTLQLTTSFGCQLTHTLNDLITVNPRPHASFIAAPNDLSIDQPTVQFIDGSTDAVMWDWDFGDHQTSVISNPFHTYRDAGTFTATLIAINKFGCNDTVQQTIRVNAQPALFIPNAFTPGNNDGVNDRFIPVGNGITIFEMYIFDRWGKQLFKTNDLENGWDGRVNETGELVKEGVYVYKIDYTDVLHRSYHYSGSVFVKTP
ncbi:MAG TPA: PKD domain-containing protein, partial [Chitinophagales bacterium]|nr:PKD domain-containing protein [Chitinophagales bacterium]